MMPQCIIRNLLGDASTHHQGVKTHGQILLDIIISHDNRFYCNLPLCFRYTKRPAPPPPSSEGSVSTFTGDEPAIVQNGRPMSPFLKHDLPISTDSKLNRRYVNPKKAVPANLAHTKLNTRYTNGEMANGNIPNGHVPNGDVRSHGKRHGNAARDKILRKRTPDGYRYSASDASEIGSVKSSADMDQWVDKLFSPVHGNMEDLLDARSLEHKMKGGGDLQVCLAGPGI